MNKIFEKIYSEKDISKNISIFFGSTVVLIVYYFTKNIYLSLIFLVAAFSICKVISSIIIKKVLNSNAKKKNFDSYTEIEKEAINVFIQKKQL